ncbi:unnamed protein product [Closterium sp. NIES-65]|nr:unnamed protein product [Closterium sp. NIES-65]
MEWDGHKARMRLGPGEVKLGEGEWREGDLGEAGEPRELGGLGAVVEAQSGFPQVLIAPPRTLRSGEGAEESWAEAQAEGEELRQGEHSQSGMGGSCSPHRREGWRGEKEAEGEAEGGFPEGGLGGAEEAERTRLLHWLEGEAEEADCLCPENRPDILNG